MQDGLEAMGLELFAHASHRLPQLTTVRVPDGADDAEVRTALLDRWGIEIGGGVGDYAGSAWRIGCMGHTARPEHVERLLAALSELLGLALGGRSRRSTTVSRPVHVDRTPLLLRPLVLGTSPSGRRSDAATPTSFHGSPKRVPGAPDPVESRDAFAIRCGARQRERQLGTGYGYGIFVDRLFAGEINLSIVQRGPFQSSYVGYWVDEARAGRGSWPRPSCACAVRVRGAVPAPRADLDHPAQHREPSCRREARFRDEGTAERYLEINGVWEDHVRYAMTAEEWEARRRRS